MKLGAVATAALLLTLTACSQPSAIAGTWGVGGQEPQLVLSEDGRLSGTDGCNRLTGSWQQEGDQIKFGETASTAMACEGFDAWLADLATAKVSGKNLVILDANGSEIGQLNRQ